VRLFLIAFLVIFPVTIISCTGVKNNPLIPDRLKDRMTSVSIDGNRMQRFELDGISVTFYPDQMRIIIENTGTSHHAQNNSSPE
jgi:hypothetical protein